MNPFDVIRRTVPVASRGDLTRAGSTICALTLVMSACGGVSDGDVAATPAIETSEGQSIEISEEVAALVDGIAIPTTDLEAITLDGATATDLAASLRRLIIHQVLDAAVSELGVVVGEADIDVTRARIVDEVTAESGLSLDEVMAAAGLNEAAFDLLVRQSALADAVEGFLAANAPPPRDEDLQELFDEEVADRTSVCSAHILVDTEAEAISARDRVQSGEDFGDLARELSTGPSGPNGGDLGCANPAQFVPAFASATLAADVGVAVGPVQTEFGFHVILVTERVIPTLDDMREELTARLVGDVFPVWLAAEIEAVTVEVNPGFGTWVTDPAPSVVPAG